MTGDCELPGPASHPDLSAPSLLAEELWFVLVIPADNWQLHTSRQTALVLPLLQNKRNANNKMVNYSAKKAGRCWRQNI